MTLTRTYQEAWRESVGDHGSSLVALSTVLMAGLGNVAYSIILADTTRDLILGFGVAISRTGALIMVTVFALLPLCLAKNLAVLAPFSLVGMGAMVFTLLVMMMRYYDGTYDSARDGKFLAVSPSGYVLKSFLPVFQPALSGPPNIFVQKNQALC